MTTNHPTLGSMEEITTPEALDAIIGRVLVLDKDGCAWQTTTYDHRVRNWVCSDLEEDSPYTSVELLAEFGPLRVAYSTAWEGETPDNTPRFPDEDGDMAFQLEMNWAKLGVDDLAEALGFLVAAVIGRLTHNGVRQGIPVNVLSAVSHQMWTATFREALDYIPRTVHPDVQAYADDEDGDDDE